MAATRVHFNQLIHITSNNQVNVSSLQAARAAFCQRRHCEPFSSLLFELEGNCDHETAELEPTLLNYSLRSCHLHIVKEVHYW